MTILNIHFSYVIKYLFYLLSFLCRYYSLTGNVGGKWKARWRGAEWRGIGRKEAERRKAK